MKTYLCTDRGELSGSNYTLRSGSRRFAVRYHEEGFVAPMLDPEGSPPDYPKNDYADVLASSEEQGQAIYKTRVGLEVVCPETWQMSELNLDANPIVRSVCGEWVISDIYLPRSQYETEFYNCATKERYRLPGHYSQRMALDGSRIVAAYGNDGSSITSICVCLDIATRETIWRKDGLGFPYRLDTNLFHGREKIHDVVRGSVYSAETGEKLRELAMPVGFAINDHSTPGQFVGKHPESGVLFGYDIEKDAEQQWPINVIDGKVEKGGVSIADNELVCFHKVLKRLRIWSWPEVKLLHDLPFDPPFVTDQGESYREIYEVHKISDGVYVYQANASDETTGDPTGGAGIQRACVFSLDELKANQWHIEHEQFACERERIENADGDSEYRVFFTEQVPFDTLYRHCGAYLFSVVIQFGYVGNGYKDTSDRDWAGLIRLDLRNQALDEHQRRLLSLIPLDFHQRCNGAPLYRAGTDPRELAVVELEFADD